MGTLALWLTCFAATAWMTGATSAKMPPFPEHCLGVPQSPAANVVIQKEPDGIIYAGDSTDVNFLRHGMASEEPRQNAVRQEWELITCVPIGDIILTAENRTNVGVGGNNEVGEDDNEDGDETGGDDEDDGEDDGNDEGNNNGNDEGNDDGNGPNDFIYRGFIPRRGTYSQYTVTVQVQYLGRWYHICTGALIASNKVLTAAHCMLYYGFLPYRCGLGWFNLRTDENNKDAQTIAVKKAKVHEKYSGYPKYDSDIAMLTLAKCAKYTRYVLPIQVAPRYLYLSYYYLCEQSGWGRTEDGSPDKIRARYTRVIERRTCRIFADGFFGSHPGVEMNNICDLDWPGRSSACSGDSGGPLACRGFLVGLVSWGATSCDGCTPTVNVGVQYFNRWIENNL